MLKYLVLLTSDLMSAGIIIGMLFAYIKYNYKEKYSMIHIINCFLYPIVVELATLGLSFRLLKFALFLMIHHCFY